MGVLVSKLFTDGDQAATAKLEGCATGQPSEVASHFSQGQNKTGEHVRRTQQALQNIQKNEPSLGIPPFSVSGLYDSAFARAIAVYKDRRNIRNFANKIDDVVGIKTIRRLDQDQVTIEGKGGGNTGPPAQRKGQDVYIKIFGFDNPSQQGRDVSSSAEAQSFAAAINGAPGYLGRHFPLQTVWFIGGFNNSPVPQITIRTLLIMVGHKPFEANRIFISGGSSGGKNALQVAERLATAILPIKFIGIWDGAFQREDLLDPSQFDKDENFNPEKPATLRFKGPTSISCEKLNFFQSWGHTLNKFEEVHGEVASCTQTDLTHHPNVEAVKRRFDAIIFKTGSDRQKAIDDAHVAAFKIGRDASEARVKALLTAG